MTRARESLYISSTCGRGCTCITAADIIEPLANSVQQIFARTGAAEPNDFTNVIWFRRRWL